MYKYELILVNEHTTSDDWFRLVNVISSRVKGFHPFSLDVVFDGSLVRFFTLSPKDLSHISNGLDGFLLLPIEEQKVSIQPNAQGSLLYVSTPKLGTLLDLKEKYLVKKGIDLIFARFSIQRLFGLLAWRKIYYFNVHGVTKKFIDQDLKINPKILDIDFFSNSSYVKKRVSNYLDIEKTTTYFNNSSKNALLKVDTFPYTVKEKYLHLSDFEFDKHSFIVGSSGSGKSRFIQLFIDRLRSTQLGLNYRVIVVDPHDTLREDLIHIENSRIINFSKEGASLFPDAQADITASTELTSTLLLSMMGSTSNARLERVLRFSVFILFVAQAMSLSNLKKFVTDMDARRQILEHVKGYIPENLEHFFGSEFAEIKTQYYTEAIQPIVALVDEMELQPTLNAGGEMSIAHIVEENFLTVFSLNKVRMGEKVVKTVAGLLIQQIFLLAQSGSFRSKVLLFVDEVSVVQNPALAAILAEARKFGMSIILTQQYFGQVESTLQQAILSNAINYYVFKVSEEDARILEGNLSMDIPKEIVEREIRNGISESEIRVKLMTDLHPRDCIVRVAAGGKILPAIKARTMDISSTSDNKFSQDESLQSYEKQELPTKFSYKQNDDNSDTDEGKSYERIESTPRISEGVPLVTENKSVVQSNRIGNTPSSSTSKRAVQMQTGPSMFEVLATQSSSRLTPDEFHLDSKKQSETNKEEQP